MPLHFIAAFCCKLRKPDSVSKLSFICDEHYWSPVAAYPGSSNEQPSNEPIRGITALKVYPCIALLQHIVSSYLTFSPLPRKCGIVIFCGTVCCSGRGTPPLFAG